MKEVKISPGDSIMDKRYRKNLAILCVILIQLSPILTLERSHSHSLGIQLSNAHVSPTSTSNKIENNIFKKVGQRLTNSAYYSENPRIAIDSQGKIHVCWQDGKASPVNPTDYTLTYGIYYKQFDGIEWKEDIFLSEEPTASYPVLSIDSSNRIHVIWQDSRSGETVDLFYKNYDESGWGINQQITEGKGILPGSGLAERPSLVIDSQDQLHVSWGDNRVSMNNYEIFYKIFHNDKWDADHRVTNVWGKSKNPSLVIDSQNNIHLAWEDDREGNKEIYYKTLSNSGVWSEDEQLTSAEKASILPVIVADSQDNLHLFWIDQRHGSWEVFYKVQTQTGWSPDVQLTKGNFARSLAAAVDANDNIHVIYYDARMGKHAIYHLMKNAVGWSSETQLVVEKSTKMRNPSVIADSNGYLHVVWADERDGPEKSDIYYKSGFPNVITVSTPKIAPGSDTNTIDIIEINAESSHPDQGVLDGSEVNSAFYKLYDSNSNPTAITGNLTWNGQEWLATGVDVSSLSDGEYSVGAFFSIESTSGASHELTGRETFKIPVVSVSEFQFQAIIPILPIFGIVLLSAISQLRPRRAFKKR